MVKKGSPNNKHIASYPWPDPNYNNPISNIFSHNLSCFISIKVDGFAEKNNNFTAQGFHFTKTYSTNMRFVQKQLQNRLVKWHNLLDFLVHEFLHYPALANSTHASFPRIFKKLPQFCPNKLHCLCDIYSHFRQNFKSVYVVHYRLRHVKSYCFGLEWIYLYIFVISTFLHSMVKINKQRLPKILFLVFNRLICSFWLIPNRNIK